MVEIEGAVNSFLGVIGQITGAIRGMITSLAPEYSTIVLLAVSFAGGYYLNQRYPNALTKWAFVLYGIIFFLLLKFV